MKIFVYGWYGHENIGDESYKLSFKETWSQHEFIFSDNVKEEDINKFDLMQYKCKNEKLVILFTELDNSELSYFLNLELKFLDK